VAKQTRKTKTPAVDTGSFGDAFPETKTEVLAQAAAGNWSPFLREYLRPCWREVVIACRSRNIPLPDADDLYQELMVQLIRDGRFGQRIRDVLAEQHQDPDFRGNLPGRYLKSQELSLRSARFRTYLKNVIKHLVLGAVRSWRRRPKPLADEDWKSLEPWIEQSISQSLDRQWVIECLWEAAGQLRLECARARTRGRQRLFEILYLSVVRGKSPGEIAAVYEIDRTTASTLLSEAKGRLVLLLQQTTRITNLEDLKGLLANFTEELKTAISRVHQSKRTT
jgi:DNA-directed RNA polymerase specialized sigma24 family protein